LACNKYAEGNQQMVKILFLASNPDATSPLYLDEEIRSITNKIRASDYRDVLELVSLWAVRPDDLLQALNEHKPQIVHFSGHGSTTGEIVLMDHNRQVKPVSAAALKMLFTTLKGNIQLVVLNACYSQTQAEAITEVVDCAIGMSTAVGDEAAIAFAASFYRAVGFGCSIQAAFDQGITALLLDGIPEDRTPELLVKGGIDPSKLCFIQPFESSGQIAAQAVDSQFRGGGKEFIGEPVSTIVPGAPGAVSLVSPTLKPIHNLPPRSEFIGREGERTRIHEALSRSRSHLVSISGIGGVGKTSLALEVAYECLHASEGRTQVEGIAQFSGFVWVSAGDRNLTLAVVLDTIAQTLRYDAILREQPLDEKKVVALQLLQDRPCLVIVDSFENVTDDTVGKFLNSLPEPSKALVTTREQELVSAEAKLVSLAGLPEADAEKLIYSEERRLELNLKSARYTRSLQQLYRATRGLPLAIKWAMGQIKQRGQSLDKVLTALDNAHGNIFDDMFSCSWEMLSPAAQQVLMVMPIFVVGASLDGIEAASGLHPPFLDEALGQLVEMSLAIRAEDEEFEQQYFGIHPLTRSFAGAKLKMYPQMYSDARKRLAEFFESYTGKAGGLWNIEGFRQLKFDLPNVLSTVQWCWEQHLAELGTNILYNIRYFIVNYGSWNDALELSNRAIELVIDLENNTEIKAIEEEWKLKALHFRIWPVAWIHRLRGDLPQAEAQIIQALTVFERIGDEYYIAYAKRHLGLVARDLGDLEKAQRLFREALEYAQSREDLYRVHLLTADLATLALKQEDFDAAWELSSCVLDESSPVTDEECIARFYRVLGSIACKRGESDKARGFFEEALHHIKRLDYRDGIADTLFELAKVEREVGLEQQARQRLAHAQEIYQNLGMDSKAQMVANLTKSLEGTEHTTQ
jgi:tetratricopeptide (TPR) repeat protein